MYPHAAPTPNQMWVIGGESVSQFLNIGDNIVPYTLDAIPLHIACSIANKNYIFMPQIEEDHVDAFLSHVSRNMTSVSTEEFTACLLGKLNKFKSDGTGFTEELRQFFPFCMGDAPPGHPYPEAFGA